MQEIDKRHHIISAIGTAIFAIRWLLVPIYLLLYVALGVYLYKYIVEIWDMLIEVQESTSATVMLGILELIDMGMIANLVVMTTIGGYSIFVKEFANGSLQDRPRWLNANFSSSEQKIKLGMSLIGVCLVNMLNDFITSADLSWDNILKRVLIVAVFLIATMCFCLYNLLMHSPSLSHKSNTSEH